MSVWNQSKALNLFFWQQPEVHKALLITSEVHFCINQTPFVFGWKEFVSLSFCSCTSRFKHLVSVFNWIYFIWTLVVGIERSESWPLYKWDHVPCIHSVKGFTRMAFPITFHHALENAWKLHQCQWKWQFQNGHMPIMWGLASHAIPTWNADGILSLNALKYCELK